MDETGSIILRNRGVLVMRGTEEVLSYAEEEISVVHELALGEEIHQLSRRSLVLEKRPIHEDHAEALQRRTDGQIAGFECRTLIVVHAALGRARPDSHRSPGAALPSVRPMIDYTDGRTARLLQHARLSRLFRPL